MTVQKIHPQPVYSPPSLVWEKNSFPCDVKIIVQRSKEDALKYTEKMMLTNVIFILKMRKSEKSGEGGFVVLFKADCLKGVMLKQYLNEIV